MTQWTHYPFVFSLKFCSNDFLALSSSLSYLLFSVFSTFSPAPLKVVLAPSVSLLACFSLFIFFPLSIVSFDNLIWFHSCDQCWFKPSRSLIPAPAFSLSQTLKPYLSKTSSQDSHLLVSQMQFIQAGLPNILSKAQTQVFSFPFSQAFSSLKFPLWIVNYLVSQSLHSFLFSHLKFSQGYYFNTFQIYPFLDRLVQSLNYFSPKMC